MTHVLRRPSTLLFGAGLVLAAIVFAALVLYAERIEVAGFFYDDWANAAQQRFDAVGFKDRYAAFREGAGARPLSALWGTVLWRYGNEHPQALTTIGILFAMLAAGVLFATLRRVGAPLWPALVIAVLWFVSPMASATRLWISATTGNGVTILALLGIACVASAYRSSVPKRRAAWHILASCLFALMMLWAEIAAAVVLALPLLLWHLASWRVQLRRWIADVVVLVPLAVYIARGSEIPTAGGFSDQARHAWEILLRALPGFGSTLAPEATTAVAWWLLAIAVVVIGVAAVEARADHLDVRRVRPLLHLAGSGVVVVLASYVVFVPAEATYLPLREGVHDRINILASIGYAMSGVAVVALAAELLLRARVTTVRDAATILLVSTALIGNVIALSDRIEPYRQAAQAQEAVLATMTRSIPNPAPGSTVYVFDHRQWYSDVPVFASQWDFRGAVRMTYGDGSLDGFTLGPWTDARLACTPTQIEPRGTFFPDGSPYKFDSRYGAAYLIDADQRISTALTDRAVCESAAVQVAEFYTTVGTVR